MTHPRPKDRPATPLHSVRHDFDHIARLVADAPDRPDRYEPFLLAQLPEPPGRVLEVGCGAGRLARSLAARGATVTALDASPEMIDLARRRTGKGAPIEFVCADFQTHALAPGSFDGVVSVATLHHLPAAPALERMKRLVRTGGVLVVHDVRSPAGPADWLHSGLAAALNGDALWWLRHRLGEGHDLRHAWHAHGAHEHYPTLAEAGRLRDAALPGARLHWHPLWRYTLAWAKRAA